MSVFLTGKLNTIPGENTYQHIGTGFEYLIVQPEPSGLQVAACPIVSPQVQTGSIKIVPGTQGTTCPEK